MNLRRHAAWVVLFSLFAATASAEVPADFPQFIVPGQEQPMRTLRELFWLHHQRVGPASTLWDEWMSMCALWPAHDPGMRQRFSAALSSRHIDEEGYVASHQHPGLGHADGWPFPMWVQGNGVGWHFTLKDMPFAAALQKATPEGFELTGIADKGVDEDGWHLHVNDSDATLTSPPIRLKQESATWLKICWNTSGFLMADPVLEWTTDTAPEFAAERSMHIRIDPASGFGHSMIPVYRSPGWRGTITRFRIRFTAPKGADICIRYLCSTWESRQTVNNSNFIEGCCSYFHWTNDIAFLRANIQRMRLAMHFITDDLGIEKYDCIHTPWPGHDGRSGLVRRADGKAEMRIGQGIGNNYWDLLPFGGDDCLATIYAFDAMNQFATVEQEIASHPEWDLPRDLWGHDANWLRQRADRVRESAGKKFWSDSTGRFVACIDFDGVAHDYGYTFLNLEAISYGFATPEQSQRIMQWISGARTVDGDTSTGADLYHYVFAPRASTRRNIDWYIWAWSDPGAIPFGGQVQDGGAVLGFSYHDLDARLITLGPDDAWQRLQEILKWFDHVQNAGGYRAYYKDGSRGTLQGAGVPGGLGLDSEFLESDLVPQIMVYGFAGFEPHADSFTMHPRLPTDWPELRITGVRWHEHVLDLKITNDSVTIETGGRQIETKCDPGKAVEIRIPQ